MLRELKAEPLKLSKERFALIGKIKNVIKDIRTQIPATKEIQITLSPSDKPDGPIYIDANKVRI